MKLDSLKVLSLDFQTTGMRPPQANLLEAAWSEVEAGSELSEMVIQRHLVHHPDLQIPPRVQQITGLKSSDLVNGLPEAELAAALFSAMGRVDALVIHYAQFEIPFIKQLFTQHLNKSDLDKPILCTHKITKRLFPNLPCQNIRATAGFFGPAMAAHNQAQMHVRATAQIWRGLSQRLAQDGIQDLASLQTWLSSTKPSKRTRIEYRLEKLRRLELPDCPGVYRMLSQNGQILYVGKATSLKSRVNSYFRGQKNRDPRKLEMLAQVWDLDVTQCRSPLESALLESDEIKRHNPPYNIVLKTGHRALVFYDRTFSRASLEQTKEFCIGPFRLNSWIENLRRLEAALVSGEFSGIFFQPLPDEDLRLGFELFCTQYDLVAADGEGRSFKSVREFLHQGYLLPDSILQAEPEASEAEELVTEERSAVELNETADDELDDQDTYTIEDLAAKFARLFARAARELKRSRQLGRLLNARVLVGADAFELNHGRINYNRVSEVNTQPHSPTRDILTQAQMPWDGLSIDTFDRLSILLSAVQRSPEGRIERRFAPSASP
jgi:DNA polymerase-3 subunit epsilon